MSKTLSTFVDWIRPVDEPPPFDKPILAIIGEAVSQGRGPFVLLRYIDTVVVVKDSPNEEDVHDLDNDIAPWDDLQFYVLSYQQHLEGAEPEMDADLYSDAILWWSPAPTFE